MMKNNVLARVKAFHQEVEKFSARWHQLKPGNDALEGDNETLDKAVAVIKEKRQEFVEIEENMNKIGSVKLSLQFHIFFSPIAVMISIQSGLLYHIKIKKCRFDIFIFLAKEETVPQQSF